MFQRSVVPRQEAVLDGFLEPIELRFGLGGALPHFGDLAASLVGPFLSTIRKMLRQRREAVRIEQSGCEVIMIASSNFCMGTARSVQPVSRMRAFVEQA